VQASTTGALSDAVMSGNLRTLNGGRVGIILHNHGPRHADIVILVGSGGNPSQGFPFICINN
jgi:hypothetical protein